MNNENNYSSDGIGFSGALFLTLLILKLTNTIDWSWWWITMPLWGGAALVIIGFLMYVLLVLVLFKKKKPKKFDQHEGVITHHDINKESKFMKKLKEVMEANDQRSDLN